MPATKQSDAFLQGEGDAWYERNRDKPRTPDPVIEAMVQCIRPPNSIVEFGCGTGWRLAEIIERFSIYECHVRGYEPSEGAVKEKVIPNVYRSDALTALKKETRTYDLVIFGFCLYLVDREDLMMIAAHADRILKDGGHIIIHDFRTDAPHKRVYKHKEGIWTYKMFYAGLWLANPAYRTVQTYTALDKETAVHILKKDMANAYPERKA